MTNFLEVGDVIEIKAGMKIYAQIPEKFIYSNKPLSSEFRTTDIRVGELLKNNIINWEEEKMRLARSIKESFENVFGFASKEAIDEFVAKQIPDSADAQETLDTHSFVGEYVVVEASLSGGSVSSYRPSDSYPDGHHVVCQRLSDGVFDPNGETINFYQSGAFTAMIEEIALLRKMNPTFVG